MNSARTHCTELRVRLHTFLNVWVEDAGTWTFVDTCGHLRLTDIFKEEDNTTEGIMIIHVILIKNVIKMNHK